MCASIRSNTGLSHAYLSLSHFHIRSPFSQRSFPSKVGVSLARLEPANALHTRTHTHTHTHTLTRTPWGEGSEPHEGERTDGFLQPALEWGWWGLVGLVSTA